jgi:hypothetical protein
MSKTWGTPTWLFFHSLAEQMTDECYEKNKVEICDILKTICNHLPCNECRIHATQYTKYTLNPNNVPDKKSLKEYFFNFHNSVNVRLGKGLFNNFNQYKNARLENIFKNFSIAYTGKSITRNFNEQFIRKNIIKKVENFLNRNKHQIIWL